MVMTGIPGTGLFSPVETSVHIDAPPARTFELVTDPDTYPSWLAGAGAIRTVDDAVAIDARRRIVLDVHAGPVHSWLEVAVADDDPDGSLVRIREQATGIAGFATGLLRPALHLRNRWSLESLARLATRGG
jgi:carbon monoxide dehydrogenase subunit G